VQESQAQQLLAQDPASKMLGIEIVSVDDNSARLRMLISESHCNGYRLCHGGFIFTLADTALAFVAAESGFEVLSAGAQIEFLRPATCGDVVEAVAELRVKSGRQLFAEVIVENQSGQTCALLHGRLVKRPTQA